MEELIGQLMDTGFSDLEARVYVQLLQESGVTGYRLAQLLNKPVANLYKALDSLHRKGVILVDETQNKKVYRAMPIQQYFDSVQDEFTQKRLRIEEGLRHLEQPVSEGGMFTIEDFGQIFSIATDLLKDCRTLVMINAGRYPLERLGNDIAACVQRGVDVFIKTTSDLLIPGCRMIREKDDLYYRVDLDHEWLNIIVDSREQLIAFLNVSERKAYQGLWVRNAFTVTVAYSGMAHDLILNNLLTRMDETESIEAAVNEMEDLRRSLMDNDEIRRSLGFLFSPGTMK